MDGGAGGSTSSASHSANTKSKHSRFQQSHRDKQPQLLPVAALSLQLLVSFLRAGLVHKMIEIAWSSLFYNVYLSLRILNALIDLCGAATDYRKLLVGENSELSSGMNPQFRQLKDAFVPCFSNPMQPEDSLFAKSEYEEHDVFTTAPSPQVLGMAVKKKKKREKKIDQTGTEAHADDLSPARRRKRALRLRQALKAFLHPAQRGRLQGSVVDALCAFLLDKQGELAEKLSTNGDHITKKFLLQQEEDAKKGSAPNASKTKDTVGDPGFMELVGRRQPTSVLAQVHVGFVNEIRKRAEVALMLVLRFDSSLQDSLCASFVPQQHGDLLSLQLDHDGGPPSPGGSLESEEEDSEEDESSDEEAETGGNPDAELDFAEALLMEADKAVEKSAARREKNARKAERRLKRQQEKAERQEKRLAEGAKNPTRREQNEAKGAGRTSSALDVDVRWVPCGVQIVSVL